MKMWPTNYAMGRRARDGVFLVFEAWGRVDVRALVDANAGTTARLEKTQLYRDELLNVLLVESSYREKRILHSVLLVDAGGMTSEHAKLLRFLDTVRWLSAGSGCARRVSRPLITCCPLGRRSLETCAARFIPDCSRNVWLRTCLPPARLRAR